MKKLQRKFLRCCVVAASVLAASSSQASLIPAGTIDLKGAGLGHVATILTVHDNDGTETGTVGWNGSANFASGDVVGPNVQTKTQLFGDIHITTAASIRIIFNASEPGGGPVNLDNLVMSIYNPAGLVVFSSGVFASQFYANTQPGVGNAGFEYQLDDSQALMANPFVVAGNRVGLHADVSQADGGNETFFILRGEGAPPCNPQVESCGPQEVPEPGTLAMLGIGLVATGALSRRRKA